jgi:hypothetical protein
MRARVNKQMALKHLAQMDQDHTLLQYCRNLDNILGLLFNLKSFDFLQATKVTWYSKLSIVTRHGHKNWILITSRWTARAANNNLQITLKLLDKDLISISGTKNKHVNHAHEISFLFKRKQKMVNAFTSSQLQCLKGLRILFERYHSRSCQTATNVNTTHILSSFLRDPPRGMYKYLQQEMDNRKLHFGINQCICVLSASAPQYRHIARKYPMETNIQWKPRNLNMGLWISNIWTRSCSSLYKTFCEKTPACLVVSCRKLPKLMNLYQSKPWKRATVNFEVRPRIRSPLLPCELSGSDVDFGSCKVARHKAGWNGDGHTSAWCEIQSRRGCVCGIWSGHLAWARWTCDLALAIWVPKFVPYVRDYSLSIRLLFH